MTHRRVCTQTLLHTDAFTHRRFNTQTLLHTEACTHRRFYTQTLLHTDAFAQRRSYTQTLLHTDAFTHRRFTQDAFTHRLFYTKKLLHTGLPRFVVNIRNFTSVFGDRTSFRAKGLPRHTQNLNFTSVFGDRTSFRAKWLPNCKIAILPQFWAIEPHFVRKSCRGALKNRNFTSFFWQSNLISCERVAAFVVNIRNFTSVFGDRTSFRAKGLPRHTQNLNFTSVFSDRTSFRAKALPPRL